ncbi:MAG: hypothetical protein RJA70_1814 [Pseudomonadota bacterium]
MGSDRARVAQTRRTPYRVGIVVRVRPRCWCFFSLLAFGCSSDEQFGGDGQMTSSPRGSRPSSPEPTSPSKTNSDGSESAPRPPRTPPPKGVIPNVRPATCAGLESRFDECELLKPGPFLCDEPTSETEECFFQCNLLATCSVLRDSACERSVADPLARCYAACDSFECSDLSVVPKDVVCDGEPDCVDAEDEQGCEWFRCGSQGEDIPSRLECDGSPDCADGSDEHDACYDGVFACVGSDELLPPDYECDGEPDCADGSDEHANCVVEVYECRTSGEAILAQYECDGEEDCLDGSDEHDLCGGFACE